jgi:hypothetical protein
VLTRNRSAFIARLARSRIFLLVFLEAAEERLLLKAEGFLKDVSEDALTLSLEQLAELTLALRDATYTSLDSSEGPHDFRPHVEGPILQIRFPGFRLSLSVLRKQPVIHWRDDG